MGDGTKKSKLSWSNSKSLVRKWFNIRGKSHDFHADDAAAIGRRRGGGDSEWMSGSFSRRESCTVKKSRTERRSSHERSQRSKIDLDAAEATVTLDYRWSRAALLPGPPRLAPHLAAGGHLRPRAGRSRSLRMEGDILAPRLDRRYSVNDRVMYGSRPSDYEANYHRWEDENNDGESPSTVFSPMSYGYGNAPPYVEETNGTAAGHTSHLTSGHKDGDEHRRNSDVMEILRKTRFPMVYGQYERSAETVLEHDRIVWLGDLNYRIALSYRAVKALVEMRDWKALLEKDQLRSEQRGGRVFPGWNEGRIYFPPTYKYSNNSDKYAGEDMNQKEKKRTPAWCDRILWYGRGLSQLSYVRGESRFSDHRPVYSMFSAEVESINHSRIQKMSSSSSQLDIEELLPYSYGYTDINPYGYTDLNFY
ncbi:unnamed protein product [Triticum turgidum subsp. durum]|uniref:Inositol polyphosphate-related phosphatase domain-containing protein n=1 Tax=Triticum turgidum subsp. durum TaxID=4567 RepID=A0A9R1B0M0_TRITD|nr:unnamed protein product [Triticum turgidum subsp. durum]